MLCSGNGSHVRSDIPFAIWELIKVIHCDAELSFFSFSSAKQKDPVKPGLALDPDAACEGLETLFVPQGPKRDKET